MKRITTEQWADSQTNERWFWTMGACKHGFYEIEHRLPYYQTFLFPELRSPINGALIDVGCGPCSIFRVLPGSGARVMVDPILDPALNLAYGLDGLRVQARGEELPFPEDTFDTAFCLNCLDHVQDPELVINEITRVLKPNGVFYLVVDLKEPGTEDYYHKIVFNQSEVDTLLASFETIRKDLVPHGTGNPAIQYVAILHKPK